MIISNSLSVFRLPSKFLIHGYNKTTTGLWIAREPAEVFENVAELGERVLRMLAQPIDVVPHPEVWDGGAVDFYVKAAGCRSHKQFMEQSKLVSVDGNAERITVGPQRRRITRRSWVGIPNADVGLVSPDPSALGATILAAFDRAE